MRPLLLLRQSINLSAILALRRLLTRPSLLLPTITCGGVSDIDFEALSSLGVRAVVFDKDNTLCIAYADRRVRVPSTVLSDYVTISRLHPSVVAGVESAKRLFPGRCVIMLFFLVAEIR